MKRGKPMKRTEMKRGPGPKRTKGPKRHVGKNRHYRNNREIDEANKRAFKEASFVQGVCAACGRRSKEKQRDDDGKLREVIIPWEAHHVIEKKWLRANGHVGLVWDIRNSLRLCEECHGKHTIGSRKLLLSMLVDDNYEFAEFVLGMAAAEYLRRKYDGTDQRWIALSMRCDAALAAARAERDSTMLGQ